MTAKRIALISALVALLNLSILVVGATVPVLFLPNAHGLAVNILISSSDFMLQPLAAVWEPKEGSSFALGLMLVFANSFSWGVMTAMVLLVLRRAGQRRKPAKPPVPAESNGRAWD